MPLASLNTALFYRQKSCVETPSRFSLFGPSVLLLFSKSFAIINIDEVFSLYPPFLYILKDRKEVVIVVFRVLCLLSRKSAL